MKRTLTCAILVGFLCLSALAYQFDLKLPLSNFISPISRTLSRSTLLNADPLNMPTGSPTFNNAVASLPRIPRHIHMTWKTKNLPYWSKHQGWQKMNPGYNFTVWTDADIVTFLADHHPRFTPLLNKLNNIERADLIRYAVLYTYGGIYADLDAKLLKKIDDWATIYSLPPSTTALIGIEAFLKDNEERILVSFARVHQYCQWTMMSAPRHPVMMGVLNLIYNVVSGKRPLKNSGRWRVLETTGPGIFSDGVEAFMNSTDKEIYPTIIVPQIAFAVGGYPMNRNTPTKKSLVHHYFMGSWKG